MTGVFVVIGNIDSLINMFSAIMWLWYGTAVFGVIIMRLTRPHVHRPFEGKGRTGQRKSGRKKNKCEGKRKSESGWDLKLKI